MNLLSHILKCGVCNSSMRVVNTKVSYESEPAYMCTAFHARKHVPFLGGRCTNSLRRPVAEVNGAVLSWLDAELLREQLVRDTIDEVRRRIEARLRERATDATRARQRAAKLRAECARLAELAMGAPPGAESVFYDQIGERKRELDGRDARLRAMAVAPSAVDQELRRHMGEASRRSASMRDVLAHAAPQAARALLTQLFPQGITADPVVIPNPEGKGRREQKRLALSGESTGAWPLLLVAEGPATHALLAAGNAAGGGEVTRSKVASPAGFEPA